MVYSKSTLLFLICSFCVLSNCYSFVPPDGNQHHEETTSLHVYATEALSTLNSFWKASPYAAAGIVCGFKAAAADAVAQKRQAAIEAGTNNDDNSITTTINTNNNSKRAGFDLRRNLSFLLYGALYQGITQEYFYNHLYPRFFGTATTLKVVLQKVACDLFLQTTTLTLPIAYTTKALIFGQSVGQGLLRYFDDIKNQGLLKKYFSLWAPVQCCTFSIVPEHLRVTFIAFVSFFWLIILSTIASKNG